MQWFLSGVVVWWQKMGVTGMAAREGVKRLIILASAVFWASAAVSVWQSGEMGMGKAMVDSANRAAWGGPSSSPYLLTDKAGQGWEADGAKAFGCTLVKLRFNRDVASRAPFNQTYPGTRVRPVDPQYPAVKCRPKVKPSLTDLAGESAKIAAGTLGAALTTLFKWATWFAGFVVGGLVIRWIWRGFTAAKP